MKAKFTRSTNKLGYVVDWFRAAATFLGASITRPREVASVVPSSPALEQGLSKLVQECAPSLVVELGPGTGGTTRALLRSLPADARLIAIEIVPEFAEALRQIGDPRLIVCLGDAVELTRILSESDANNVDLVVSGIPFSTIPLSVAKVLVADIHRSLAPCGQLVTYQVRDKIIDYTAKWFGEPEVTFILWNVPPLRVYQFAKQSYEPQQTPLLCPVTSTNVTGAVFEGS